MSKITAVIVNYNKCEYVLKCLKKVYELTMPLHRICVVDNNSQDDSVVQIKKHFPDVTVIENSENIGGAAGFNCGIRYALETGCDYIYLMDNDIEPDAEALFYLYRSLESDATAAAAGSKGLYCFDRSLIWQAGCNFNWPLQIKIHRGNGKKDGSFAEKKEYVDYMPAFSLLVRTAAVRNTGLMDERFYIYMDDADWCFRMRSNGWNILYVPESRVYHHVSAEIPSPFSIYYSTRNFLLLFKKHCSIYLLPLIYSVSCAKNILKMCIYTYKRINLKKGEYKKTVFSFFYAYLDFFSNNLGRNDIY